MPPKRPTVDVRYRLLPAALSELAPRRDTDLRPGLRSFPLNDYVIIYRVAKNELLILHIFRGSRNIAKLLKS